MTCPHCFGTVEPLKLFFSRTWMCDTCWKIFDEEETRKKCLS